MKNQYLGRSFAMPRFVLRVFLSPLEAPRERLLRIFLMSAVVNFCSSPALAQMPDMLMGASLANGEDGSRTTASDRLNLGRAVIIVSHPCAACDAYLQLLRSCPAHVQDKLDLAVLSPISAWQQTHPKDQKRALYAFIDGAKVKAHLAATPTTWVGDEQFVGPQSCERLARKLGAAQVAPQPLVKGGSS
jgi:hypothetical protein